MALLDVKVTAGYKKSVVLEDVSFELGEGEMLGLVGSSGAGKSTLLLAILGLLESRNGWVTGTVTLEGTELTNISQSSLRKLRGKLMALVPQSPLSALSPVLRIGTHLREAWLAHETCSDLRMTLRIEEVMDSVGLPATNEFLRRRPLEISVGQAQRVLIAMAMLHKPKLLIADEPTSALDPVSRMEILNLLNGLSASNGTSILYISHDILSVISLCSRIAVLERGRIVDDRPVLSMAESRQEVMKELLKSLPVPLDLLLQQKALNSIAPAALVQRFA